MSDSPAKPEAVDQEALVAYLDGELSDSAARQVESCLARDESLRREMRELEEAWSALDELPRPTAAEDFTQTTVEMVATAAEQELREADHSRQGRKFELALAGVVVLAVCGLAGFFAARSFWPNPNDALLADLAVIESVNAYRYIPDLEFARELEDLWSNYMGGPTAPLEPATTSTTSQSLTERKSAIENLTSSSRDELQHNQEYFFSQPEDEQDRMRSLHAKIAATEHGDRILQAVDSFSDFLLARSPTWRLQLGELLRQQDQRQEALAFIEQTLQESSQQLTPSDFQALNRWLHGYIDNNKQVIAQGIADFLRHRGKRVIHPDTRDPEDQQAWRHMAVGHVIFRREGVRGLTPPTEESREQLMGQLSAGTRRQFESIAVERLPKQIAQTLFHRSITRDRDSIERLFDIPAAELEEVFQSLSLDRKSELLAKPLWEMQMELKVRYLFGDAGVPGFFNRINEREAEPRSWERRKEDGPPRDRAGRKGPPPREPPRRGDR